MADKPDMHPDNALSSRPVQPDRRAKSAASAAHSGGSLSCAGGRVKGRPGSAWRTRLISSVTWRIASIMRPSRTSVRLLCLPMASRYISYGCITPSSSWASKRSSSTRSPFSWEISISRPPERCLRISMQNIGASMGLINCPFVRCARAKLGLAERISL